MGKLGTTKATEKRERRYPGEIWITLLEFGEKGHYSGNIDFPTQANLKEDAEALWKMKQEKSSNNLPGGGDHRALVNVKDALCSLMMVSPTEEWVKPPSPGLTFYQTSTQ